MRQLGMWSGPADRYVQYLYTGTPGWHTCIPEHQDVAACCFVLATAGTAAAAALLLLDNQLYFRMHVLNHTKPCNFCAGTLGPKHAKTRVSAHTITYVTVVHIHLYIGMCAG